MVPYLNLLRLVLTKRDEFPVYLIHSVTERCNGRCGHCFVTRNQPKAELTVEEIRSICPSLGKNLYLIALTGGEPFLREDLADLVQVYLDNTPAQVAQITTNGLLGERVVRTTHDVLDRERSKTVVVNVSFDGVGALHDRIRGVPGSFDRAVATYRGLQSLREHHANFTPSVNVTISAYNQDHLLPLYRYLTEQLGVPSIALTLARGDTHDPAARAVSVDAYERFVAFVARELRTGALPGYSGGLRGAVTNGQNVIARRRVAETVRHGHQVAPCFAGIFSGVVESDGKVLGCELVREPLGDLRKSTFAEIWLGGEGRRFRERARRCFCTHECVLLVNTLFYYRYLPRLLWEVGLMGLCRASNHLLARRPACVRDVV